VIRPEMTDRAAAAASIGGLALLERSIAYALGSLHLVTASALERPSPCRQWKLSALLEHLDDGVAALCEAVDGAVLTGPPDAPGRPDPDVVSRLRDRARHLLGAATRAVRHPVVSIGGRPLPAGIVTGVGALEVAVHGWDVARSCGRNRPLPAGLAEELIELAPILVGPADRPGRFGLPVAGPPQSGPGDLLLAFLGRDARV